jgi:hypothetical protein
MIDGPEDKSSSLVHQELFDLRCRDAAKIDKGALIV